ncbi:MAG TPA: ferritin-like domain-containing protein [Terriglobales bacterium]|nr:ferritin-like domain-containing protein [Terriglobales bacterium]
MAADPRMILLMNYYRDAELRGANLLFRLMFHLDDADSQVKLSLHFAEETHHAWLWTKRIHELGGAPAKVADGYQTRIGLRVIPRNLIEILALTVVVEERSLARYQEHAARPDVEPETLAILQQVSKDEKWHISWIRAKLEQLAKETEGGVEKMGTALARYHQIDEQVYRELLEKERRVFGV